MGKKTTVSLGIAIDIMHAAALKERLAAALAKDLPVVLVSDKVEKADTAGLQLLYAFITKVEKQGHRVTWQKPSDVIIQAVEILGMCEVLHLS